MPSKNLNAKGKKLKFQDILLKNIVKNYFSNKFIAP